MSTQDAQSVGYAGGALVGELGTREIPQHAFVAPMILTLASAMALMLTAEGR
jgi:hypothetical protein